MHFLTFLHRVAVSAGEETVFSGAVELDERGRLNYLGKPTLTSRESRWLLRVEAVRKQVRHLGEADGRTWSIDERSDRCGRQRKFRLAFDQGDSPLAFISSSLRSTTTRLEY
jgi:hypothetical protein